MPGHRPPRTEIEARTEMADDALFRAEEIESLISCLATEGEVWNEASKLATQLKEKIRDIRAFKF